MKSVQKERQCYISDILRFLDCTWSMTSVLDTMLYAPDLFNISPFRGKRESGEEEEEN